VPPYSGIEDEGGARLKIGGLKKFGIKIVIWAEEPKDGKRIQVFSEILDVSAEISGIVDKKPLQ
jgi:hypothetical protein